MTLTIADRWSLTLHVQSLARVTLPAPAPTTHAPDGNAVARMRQVQDDLAAERARWESEAILSGSRRMC
jgi:hypothetical protein